MIDKKSAPKKQVIKKTPIKKKAEKKQSVEKQVVKKVVVKKKAPKKTPIKKQASTKNSSKNNGITKTPPPITITAYGRHRKDKGLKGGTHQSVKKAIDSARLLKCLITKNNKTLITSADDADIEWDSKTTPDTQIDQNNKQSELNLEDKETSKKYLSARARKNEAAAEKEELELAKLKQTVLDYEKAKKQVVTIGKELTQGLTNITRSQAAALAAEDNPQIVRVMLQEMLKDLVSAAVRKLEKAVKK